MLFQEKVREEGTSLGASGYSIPTGTLPYTEVLSIAAGTLPCSIPSGALPCTELLLMATGTALHDPCTCSVLFHSHTCSARFHPGLFHYPQALCPTPRCSGPPGCLSHSSHIEPVCWCEPETLSTWLSVPLVHRACPSH